MQLGQLAQAETMGTISPQGLAIDIEARPARCWPSSRARRIRARTRSTMLGHINSENNHEVTALGQRR